MRLLLSKSYAWNFAIRRSWFIVSNALDKSINTAPLNPLLYEPFYHLPVKDNNANCVLKPFLNSHKKGDEKLFNYLFVFHKLLLDMYWRDCVSYQGSTEAYFQYFRSDSVLSSGLFKSFWFFNLLFISRMLGWNFIVWNLKLHF